MTAKHLVLLGGGHSHVEVLRSFGQTARRNHTAGPPGGPDGAAGAGLASGDRTGFGAGASALEKCKNAPQEAQERQPHHRQQESHHRLTLISRGRFTPYSGMLPGWASGFYSYGDCHIDLQLLASYAGAGLVLAEAKGIDIWARTVCFSDDHDDGDGPGQTMPPQQQQQPVPYDVLSIDVGITPESAGVPGADQYATPVKPIDGFVQRYEQLLERYRAAAATAAMAAASTGAVKAKAKGGGDAKGLPSEPVMRVCIIGGGAGGVELAAAVRYRLEEERHRGGWDADQAAVTVSLLCRGGLLPGHPPHVRRLVRQLLTQRGVDVRSGDAVTGVQPGELLLESGGRVSYDECLWCTEASPAAWLRRTGLPTDPRGFLAVDQQLQSEGGPPEVFAAGDVASCAAHPRPKAGVYAVRQGPPLAANLRAYLEGQPLRTFVPQETALALISLGDRFCVASRTAGPEYGRGRRRRGTAGGAAGGGGISRTQYDSTIGGTAAPGDAVGEGYGGEEAGEWLVGWLLNGFGGLLVGLTGPLLWRWKDSIDRAFMRKYGEDLLKDERGGTRM
ncbi:hypothetical protein PLESTB_001430200 [Pleodorina starrii]|uniref:FAD/NAD(P)-binding domain-containing protein n=1 Tax=Pleodorina starrii TaxID=330485 RepID=A0A9W6BVI6_9CHLO|nr:hypothetical protein PLESTM_001389500 [Pleodorina starrii]GLC58988.1 hypothetical protein PLESTB_001430200 [Pleodorina starrii]GLC67658.1 hypothetical protein PLESTF_000587600 [Pleodorina starrii]